MKKLSIIFMTLAMLLVLNACGGSQSDSSNVNAPPTEDSDAGLGNELVLYSPQTDGDLDALITCFNEVYPDIEVEVVNGTAGELIARIQGESAAPVGDLVWGGLADSDGDRYADIFESWVSVHDAENSPGYISTNGLYSMTHLSTIVLCVNTELEEELGLHIESYQDLLNPALKGKIISADPTSSSSAWNNICNIMAVFGNDSAEAWEYIENLMPNLVIASSSSACFKSVQEGEYVVGLTYEDGAVQLLRSGAENLRLQYPVEGTSASAFGVAVIKGAPHQEAAKAMVDFLCSAEGQSAMAEYMEGTLRFTNADYTVPDNAWLTPTDQIKWVSRDTSYLIEHKDSILEHWSDLYATVFG